jgi:pilus assembly protein CpaC
MIRPPLALARGMAVLTALAAFASGGRALAQSGAEDLRLTVGKSIVIDYPTDVRQISTSDPAIVDASPVTTREILIHGKGLGTGTLIVWNKGGERTFYSITVEANLDPLRQLIKDTFPAEDIRVQSSRDSVSLIGTASSLPVAERATALAAPFGKTIVNNIRIAAGPVEKQILLRVKFAELDRVRATQFGVNLVSTGALNTVGRITTSQFGSATPEVSSGRSTLSISDALNIFAFRPDLNLAAFIKALQNESILQILAEPNLVTTNGKEASFLVGGEFPVPVVQGTANAGAVTVQFREFGIRLMFTPTITGNNTIKMHLRQEVSTIDIANSVTLNGFTIPALSSRRAETDVELAEGQTFVVAGLLDNRESESYAKIPGLSSLPILGVLFRSREVRQSRTELVMLVTPEVTRPINAGDPAPVPYFPKDFLVPIKPPAPGSVSETPSSSTSDASGKSASRRWLGLRKGN